MLKKGGLIAATTQLECERAENYILGDLRKMIKFKKLKALFCKHVWEYEHSYILVFRTCKHCGHKQFREIDTDKRFTSL